MSKSRFAYRTDISIPNLDGMTISSLRQFAARTGAASEKQHGAKADWLRLAASYAKHKLAAMEYRSSGEIQRALRHEAACDNIYQQIPKRMRW